MNPTIKILFHFLLAACAAAQEIPRVGLYTGGKPAFGREEINFLDEGGSRRFVDEMNKAETSKIDFKWDRRGIYVIVFKPSETIGYECKPWAIGNKIVLLSIEFEFENNRFVFKDYKFDRQLQAPALPREFLESVFPIIKGMTKQ